MSCWGCRRYAFQACSPPAVSLQVVSGRLPSYGFWIQMEADLSNGSGRGDDLAACLLQQLVEQVRLQARIGQRVVREPLPLQELR